VRSLPASCALLFQQHCRKLRDVHGESGEPTVLDIGCGAGGSCFELAQRWVVIDCHGVVLWSHMTSLILGL
jgi:cyclopropane fatty-acyl-phospholipid synthase-like methyltransferase